MRGTSTIDWAGGSVVDARAVLREWEWRRLFYNGLLALWVLALMAVLATRQELVSLTFLWFVVSRCLAANVLYMAGPAAELYVRWLGVSGRWVTPVLFYAGLLASMFLAAAQIALWRLGTMD